MAIATSFRFQWNQSLAVQLEAAVEEASEELAHEAETIAKSLARVDTGEMRDGLHGGATRTPQGVQITLEGDADHTIFNELGTSRMSAQPMIRPAIDQVASKLGARIAAKTANIR